MRKLSSRVAAVVAAAGLGLLAGGASADDNWRGYNALRGGKGYVTTPVGQVHYRDVGPRDARITVLLLHMTPMSMIQYVDVQPELAQRGIRSIAVDTPGYGMSDLPLKPDPTIVELADNLVPVLDQLHLKKVVVAGYHTGASIGTAFAARHPRRVAAVILHGVPFFTPEENAEQLKYGRRSRDPRPDGRHLSQFFHPPGPGQPVPTPEHLYGTTWYTLSLFLQGTDIGHAAVYHYDMGPDLKRLSMPGLIISDTADSVVHPLDLKTARFRPDFGYQDFFPGGDGLTIMEHPKEWAKIVADYVVATIH